MLPLVLDLLHTKNFTTEDYLRTFSNMLQIHETQLSE